jgi:hypothetical protein
LNDHKILLRAGTDRYHSLGWGQLGDWSATFVGDGAVLAGHGGGVLGTTVSGNSATLIWLPNGNVWIRGAVYGTSDRAIKDEFAAVDCSEILEKVAALPLSTWHYKTEEPGVRHIGPVAQDFHAAFGLGMDDKHIATVDADGVALAAIQGLNRKVETLKGQLEQKQTEIAERSPE